MDRGKWMVKMLLFISVALGASQLDDDGETITLSVWVGQEVDLECADNSTDTTRRLWKRGDEIWLFMNEVIVHNNRVSSVNRSAIMRIVNVTLDDEGYYTCTAFTRPPHTRTLHLQVKEQLCEAPQKPVNGGYESETDTYRTGDTIQYRCDRGYQLIGESNRNCTGTIKGWQPHIEPYCQSEYIGHVLKRFDGIDSKMTAIEDKVTAIEHRMTIIENGTLEIESFRSTPNDAVEGTDKTPVTHMPVFRSKPQKLYVNEGDTVKLECEADNLDPYIIMWKKGNEMLRMGSSVITKEDRYMSTVTTLTIKGFKKSDEGEYTCRITLQDKPLLLVHSVHIKAF